jgi:hypothetical protein
VGEAGSEKANEATRRGPKGLGNGEERKPEMSTCAWSWRRRRSGGGWPAVRRASRREGGGGIVWRGQNHTGSEVPHFGPA